MPRSGWLAAGASLAAVLLPSLGERGPAVGLAVASGMVAVTLAMRDPRRAAIRAVALGAVFVALRLVALPAPGQASAGPVGDGPWRMVVESVGSPRDGKQVATLGSQEDHAPLRLAASLPAYPAVEPGTVVEVAGRTRPRPDSGYGRYLARIGAWGSLDARVVRVMPGPDDPGRTLERVRRGAGDALAAVLPEPEAGLAAGILIGLRDRVDRDLAAAFTTAGVSHVVAISGWNIAIVAAAVGALAGRLGRRRRSVVTILAIATYALFAGASASVLRAAVMAGVVLLARETGRAGRAAGALGWAAVILLIADPSLIGDAGFQLSTLATAGLIAWATPLTERLNRWTGGRLPRWLAESLGVSLAAQAATLPLVLASFGRLSLIAPAVNLVVVPLVAPAMAAGVVAMGAGLVVGIGAPVVIGSIVAAPAWVAFRAMVGVVHAAAAVPFASVDVGDEIGPILGLGTLGLGLVAWQLRRRVSRPTVPPKPTIQTSQTMASTSAPRQTRHRAALTRLTTLALVASLAVTGAVLLSRPSGHARITVLDVGQGDAILVEGSRGGRLLIDGGPDPGRLLVELDGRIPPWDRRIDAIILSHPHEDHVAGLARLLERYKVGRVFEPGMRGPGPGYAAWLDVLARRAAPMRSTLAAGDTVRVDEIVMRVLWPIGGSVPDTPLDGGTGINNVSIVLLGTIGDRRFLLAGDVEDGVDPALLTAKLPRVDVLKVAHHGSRTATTQAFVDAVRPRIAIASAGSKNRYGHPARATLQRLSDAGARVYRTDRDGTVAITFDAAGPIVRTEPRKADLAPIRAATGRLVAANPGSVTADPRRAFFCSIPVVAFRGAEARQVSPPTDTFAGSQTPTTRPGSERLVGYHRTDDRALAGRGGAPAVLPGSPTLGRRARTRRGRGRGLALPAYPAGWRTGGPSGRGGSRPAPRRGQDPAAARSGPSPPPRSRFGGLADPTGPPGARPAGRLAPGHPTGRRGDVSTLGRFRQPGGTDRGLRGQTRRPAPGVHGRPVRVVGGTILGRLGRGHDANGLAAGASARGRCLSSRAGRAGAGPKTRLDRRGAG